MGRTAQVNKGPRVTFQPQELEKPREKTGIEEVRAQ